MKILLFIFLLAGSALITLAQNKSLGVGTPTPNPNAALHVESPTNNQGFIMPRLTTLQRTGMGSLLTTADNGLMLYDTDLKTIYIWDGAVWKSTAQVAGGSKLSYPYEDIVTTNPGTVDLFALKYNATDNARVMRIENQSVTNGSSALSVSNQGVGLAGYFQVNNAASGSSALYGTTNSNLGGALAPVGVYGESSGTGSLGGAFWNTNATNPFPALYTRTLGVGNAARFEVFNAGSTAPALVAETNGTGNAIQTSGKIQAGQFLGDGSGLTNVTATNPRLTLPYQDSVLTAPANSNLFRLYYGGTAPGNVGLAYFENLNPTNAFSPLFVRTLGTGSASNFIIANSASAGAAVGATTNGTGPAVRALNTGTGNGFAGLFQNINATNTFPAIQASTVGTGPGVRVIQNATSLGKGMDVIMQNTTGTELGFTVDQQGLGGAGNFSITNASNNSPAINAETVGTGSAGYFGRTGTGFFAAVTGESKGASTGAGGAFLVTNSLGAEAIYGSTNGTGNTLSLDHIGASGNIADFRNNGSTVALVDKAGNITANSFQGDGSALTGVVSAPFTFPYNTPVNTATTAFDITNTGAGAAISATNTGGNTSLSAVYSGSSIGGRAITADNTSAASGFAGVFRTYNAANTFPAIQAQTEGPGPGVRVIQEPTSLGNGLDVWMRSTTNTAIGLTVDQQGLGAGGNFVINNVASTGYAVIGETNGVVLSAGVFGNNTGTGFGVFGKSNGTAFGSAAVYGEQIGTGDAAGAFRISNASNTLSALYGETNGGGPSVYGQNIGTGNAGIFEITNATNASSAIFATTTGTGRVASFSLNNASSPTIAFQTSTNGLGMAGNFIINNASNTQRALSVTTNGTGQAIFANHTGASGDIAIFQSSSLNVARIDKAGQGFFNGGATTGGADVAEMFDVEGARENYEPGDVLVISEATDRTVEKSSSASSTKVVGVYATKPGVTLTEKGIDENLDQLVPMGVIGVIPTKVCLENGAIKRGDLLVTSSKTGHAMKAISLNGDGVFPSGIIIGKALENFENGESGLIKVLVNVK